MFDGSFPEVAGLASLTDAEVVDGAGGWARAENAACARKLAFMAELFARRTGLPAGDRELWWVDPVAAVTAEMGAAVNVSQGMALHQTHRGVALRDRLPKVAALFEAGLINEVLVRAIVWRTYLITDEAAMAAVDAALAERITGWGALSVAKTEAAIDALVDAHDPGALRRSRESASSPTVEFGSPADVAGTTSMWARLNSPDAALIEHAVEELARSVCDADPRPINERRANALTALAARTGLACACGDPDCPGAASAERPARNAIVYVVVDQTSLDTAHTNTDPTEPDDPTDDPTDGPDDPTDDDPGAVDVSRDQPAESADTSSGSAGSSGDDIAAPAEPAATAATTTPQCQAPPAFVFGAGVMPTALLGAILDRATLREVHHPGDAPPEPRYTASRRLSDFVRCRDLTCRFPGCDKPAQYCDLDHTVAYPVGPTHPSNLKCLCRFHHLMKMFWGWRDQQLAVDSLDLRG